MEPISSEKWKEIEALLDKALDMPVAERAVYLEKASAKDGQIKTLLMEIWDAGVEAETFLERDAPPDVVQVIHQLSIENAYGPPPVKGMRFGQYEIEEEIGRGGMSLVFKAKRVDGQFDHTVAVKILKRGMDTDQLVLRFMAERQILAGLKHANIAQLLDGGATPDGRPYLVMEYVEGVPITDYCDTEKLDINSRLSLFKKVGEAVAFAHRNLIVHRDLKPSNILVTKEGEVKLLDFGIAKVISEDLDETVMALTMTGGRVMTPEYAAPEQIYGEAITTATDVYALGVLLYELLCGQLPIRYEERKFPAIERQMRTHKFSLPSVSLREQQRSDFATIEEIATARGTTSLLLTQKMEGDLDMIVQKSLRKEPERRYGAVSALMDEIVRYQEGKPIEARPDSLGYRARKFYGRHKTGVILSCLAALVLVVGVVNTLWQAQTIKYQSELVAEERDIAQREAVKSARVAEFLVNVFESTDPDNALGDTLNAYDILDRGVQLVENELETEPELQAEMMSVIGRMYQRMGAYHEAEGWLERALAQRRQFEEGQRADLLESHYNLASLMRDQGRYTEAESLLVQGLDESDLIDPSTVSQHIKIQDLLGTVLIDLGKYEDAKATYLDALDKHIELEGENHLDGAPIYAHLGGLVGLLSEFDSAAVYFEKSIEIYKANPEGTADDLAGVLISYADVLRNKGAFEEARTICEESLEIRERLFGKEHPVVLQSMNQLGNILSEMGENDEAEQIYLAALATQRETLGENHPFTLELLGNLGGNYIRMGDLREAVVHLRSALQVREEVMGKDHPTIAIALSNLGVAVGSLGNYEEAEQIHRRSLILAKQHFDKRHPSVAACASNLANVLYKLERYNEAMPYVDLAIDIDSEKLEGNHRFVAVSKSIKGQILYEMGRMEESKTLLEESIDIFVQSSLPADHHIPVRPKIALGKLHLSLGNLSDALPLLEESLSIRQRAFLPDDWRIGEAESMLGQYYLKQGDLSKARTYLEAGHKRLSEGLGNSNRFAKEAEKALVLASIN